MVNIAYYTIVLTALVLFPFDAKSPDRRSVFGAGLLTVIIVLGPPQAPRDPLPGEPVLSCTGRRVGLVCQTVASSLARARAAMDSSRAASASATASSANSTES